MQIVVGPSFRAATTHILTRASPPVPRTSYMYFVLASTSGGGVGSSRPRNERFGVYDLLVGLTGLLGSSARSFALMFGTVFAFGAGVIGAIGAGVGRIAIGRAAAGRSSRRARPRPRRGSTARALDSALVPHSCATADAALVGLGFGTPARSAGASEARAAGAALAVGAAVARATAAAVGDALGSAGAGVAALALARTIGAGGFGERRANGALVAAGDGAAVGGGLTVTATGPIVGTLSGAAGISFRGWVSKTFCVGRGLGCGDCCGIGRGFGGAVGAVFASSWRLTGST